MEESWSLIVKGELDGFPRERITMDQIASKVEGKFSKLVVIKGAPGGGKTTLSWELCRRWANGEVWTDYSLVVLLRLRDENVQEAVELVDLFQCENTDASKNVVATTIIQNCHGHGILFVLEGLDELPPFFRQKNSIFIKLITGRLLPASTVLVTTRPWAVCDLPVTCSSRVDQFIEILGFSSEQIQEYIDLMIKDGAPPELHKYINSNPRISSAMYNPLHARIVVEVYRENHENSNSIIPNTTTELYTEYCQILIKRHSDSDWSGELSKLPSSLQVHFDKLCHIAYNGITKKKQQLVFFKEDVVDTNTLGFMNSVHPLYKKSNSSPSYNFLHLTLQEFLAAFYVWRNKTPHKQFLLFETKADDGSYKMILLFLAGLTKLNDSWTQCVLPTPYVYYEKGSSKAERMCSRFSSELTISPPISYNEPLYYFGTLELAEMFQRNTTLQFIELRFFKRLLPDLLPALEALRENNTVKHLKLLYVPPLKDLIPYTVTTVEAEAVGNVLAKNKTLEVFHLNAGITDYSPIVRGLFENKTLKEFGAFKNTKKNIVTCPEYVDVRRRIVFIQLL